MMAARHAGRRVTLLRGSSAGLRYQPVAVMDRAGVSSLAPTVGGVWAPGSGRVHAGPAAAIPAARVDRRASHTSTQTAVHSPRAQAMAAVFGGHLPVGFIDTPVISIADCLHAADLAVDSRRSAQVDLSAFPGASGIDPFDLVHDDLRKLAGNVKDLLGVQHPVLATVAKYFFEFDGGKKVRPAMVMLLSRATAAHHGLPQLNASESSVFAAQCRLAEITEMIHTASLLHDDVIDMADTRRGIGSVNSVFGNKLAVLAGDFLLARASVCLARLRDVAVVEVLSTVIEHLVKGEVMQMSAALRSPEASAALFEMYLTKTYYKTASLMAHSCQASSMLANYSPELVDASHKYGKHVGLAFQLIDDLLDFEGTKESLGKPALNDIKQGLATAPVLYACRDYPAVLKLIERKFEAPGDVEEAVKYVERSDGLHRTRQLAVAHGQQALDALSVLRPSPYRDALAAIVHRVCHRKF